MNHKNMKKLNCLVALAICLLTMFSCQKPEGTLPGSSIFSGNNGLIQCSVVGNMDYAVYDLQINLKNSDQMQIDKLDLHYGLSDGALNEHSVSVLKDTILTTSYHKKDTVWGLTPDRDYNYMMTMEDFFSKDSSDVRTFRTLPISTPVVRLDTAYLNEGRVWCLGTLRYHWRAPVPVDSITPFAWTLAYTNANSVSDVDIVNSHQEGELVTQRFAFSHDLGNEVTCRFVTRVTNVWNRTAWTDTLDFALFDIRVLTERVTIVGSNSAVVYGRPVSEGDGLLLNKLGFCVAKHYNATINDAVYNASPGSMVWGNQFQLRIPDLEPGTEYYFRAYMQINSDNGNIYYGAEIPQTTWEGVPVTMFQPDEGLITSSAAYLEGMVGPLGQQQLDEYGFIWKEVDDSDPLNDAVSFDEGQYHGYYACNNIDEFQKFSGLVTNLTVNTKFWFKAYAKFKVNNEVSYSESYRVDTKR